MDRLCAGFGPPGLPRIVGAAWQAGSHVWTLRVGGERSELLEQFVVHEKNADELRGQDFNVTPTKDNPVVIARVPEVDAGEDADPVRELRAFRCGLLPNLSTDSRCVSADRRRACG